ncbi:MAG: hypothetical protein R3D26_15710 [Cyanobacteriota/Melainabacteria group bacterium]
MQGLIQLFWSEDEVNARLETIMGGACDGILSLTSESGLRPRMAALRIGSPPSPKPRN